MRSAADGPAFAVDGTGAGAGGGGWPGQPAADLSGCVREEMCAGRRRNRFVDLLEAARVRRERLTWLAGEQFRIVASDQRSFALLAARFPQPPAGEMFLSLARGELHALRLLSDFAAALGWDERDLEAYEPRPLAQAYPAYLAWCALFGICSGSRWRCWPAFRSGAATAAASPRRCWPATTW